MPDQQEKHAPTSKKFGKGQRSVPHPSEKASKYYPAEEDSQPKKARKSIRETKLRPSLQPGSVVILLAGRFRGKRVVLLKHLSQGVLLITGPFKINGVPLRRVNARYVIATSTKVDLKGIDDKVVEKASAADYFTKNKEPKGKGEDAFFSQGEKPEPKKIEGSRAEDQKSIDKALLATIRKEPYLAAYLGASFSLRTGDKPHEMKF
jgi:large subunit ribosomal protein L6e